MANPIWKDYYVNLGAEQSVEYEVMYNNETIYTGKAWKRPGQTRNLIRINELCADYLRNHLPSFGTEVVSENAHATFKILKKVGTSQMTLVESVEFYNDWSYDYDYDPETMGLSSPIIGRMDVRQLIVNTPYNKSVISAKIRLKNGESFNMYVPVKKTDDFNDDFNADFCHSIINSYVDTAVFSLAQWEDVESVTIDNHVFKVVNTCHKYALYYVNAHGGWDSLLIEGNHSEVDNLTRHTREIEYDNTNVSNRGTRNFVNEIKKALTLHTSWLSDAEASRMHHLLNSTEVYLYDLERGQMTPVLLTNATTEYKTYKGNGGKLVNYAIEVEYANGRMRR